jgi:hypothetical protein
MIKFVMIDFHSHRIEYHLFVQDGKNALDLAENGPDPTILPLLQEFMSSKQMQVSEDY